MSILTRHLPVAAAAAAVMCAGAAPALASTQHTASAATAKTPLVTKIEAETGQIRLRYLGTSTSVGTVGTNFPPTFDSQPPYIVEVQAAAGEVNGVRADSAQLTSKFEWVLGAYLETQGDISIDQGQQATVYNHPTTGRRELGEGLADWRLSNDLVAHADASLGIPHPARNIEPEAPYRGKPIPSGPGTLSTPHGLAATITMGEPALQETIPSDVETTYVNTNEAAMRYYAAVVGDMHVDGAQRAGQQDWVKGAQTQLRGDELLGKGEATHSKGMQDAATGNREMKDALGILREADSEIAHADSLLGVHTSGPSATLPSHTTYYQG